MKRSSQLGLKMREKEERESPCPKKKQVRRRLHTRKPYQEKLVNMAEARREIVTALKLHRASMNNNNNKKTQTPSPPPPPHNYYSWPVAPPSIFEGNDDFVLPDQTLGLNLNLEEFVMTPSSSIYSPSPPPSADQFEFVKSEELVSFDEVMEFPAWLNGNEQMSNYFVNDFSYFHDPPPPPAAAALPCMDIGEIEGMDGDWLA